MRRGRTPLWDELVVLHEESRSRDYYFDQRGSQVSVGASQLHDAPGSSQPTQDPLTTPPQATRVGRVSRPPEPLTYSHQHPQPPRTRPRATCGVRSKRSRQQIFVLLNISHDM